LNVPFNPLSALGPRLAADGLHGVGPEEAAEAVAGGEHQLLSPTGKVTWTTLEK
jgi:hypothetical protein